MRPNRKWPCREKRWWSFSGSSFWEHGGFSRTAPPTGAPPGKAPRSLRTTSALTDTSRRSPCPATRSSPSGGSGTASMTVFMPTGPPTAEQTGECESCSTTATTTSRRRSWPCPAAMSSPSGASTTASACASGPTIPPTAAPPGWRRRSLRMKESSSDTIPAWPFPAIG